MIESKRPCNLCLLSFEDHKVHMDLGHIFCPNQNLVEGPVEMFDCYEPCGNLKYLEWLEKQRNINHG